MRPIKTLHLTNAFHERSGGVATFYRALMDAANLAHREIRLIVPGEYDKVEAVGEYGKIYHVAAPTAPLNSSYRILYPLQFLYPGSKVQEILRTERPDVIEVSDKYCANYLGAVLRLGLLKAIDYQPLMLGLSCERMDENFATYLDAGRLSRFFCDWYMRWIYFPFFDHHIAVSKHTAEELLRASHGHAVRRGVWIRPMGVDANGFSPAHRCVEKRLLLESKAGAAPKSILLLYAGRLAPEKNLPLLIGTLRLLRADGSDYRLILVGDGMERERLQSLADEQAPGAVFFWGYSADRGELADVYANCDVFVHPNPREPFGIAPLEAMASGLALVAPDRGGITSFANDSNAALAAPEPALFAAAVRGMMADPLGRELKVKRGLETAQRYRWPAAAADYLKLYEALYAAFHNEAAGDERTREAATPDFWSTPPSKASGKFVRAIAALAKGCFRLFERHRTALQARRSHAAGLDGSTVRVTTGNK